MTKNGGFSLSIRRHFPRIPLGLRAKVEIRIGRLETTFDSIAGIAKIRHIG